MRKNTGEIKKPKELTILFGNIVMKTRMETEPIADCLGESEVKPVTALGFYSIFDSLESLLNLEQKHDMGTTEANRKVERSDRGGDENSAD